ncbi:cytidylyltransferase domain-containing protein, partial [Campylobacter jejuni]|uniref:cytidylyltransferase domain-containing protein n=1 Tax=Campylobacter jejuni TaxID=197 RepID=UPI003F498922
MIISPGRVKLISFQEKILCDIGGVPLFVATGRRVSSVDEGCIALDDENVLSIAKEYGLNAVLTSKGHESGTDRINEACKKQALQDDAIIINVQADERFIEWEDYLNFNKIVCYCQAKKDFLASWYYINTSQQAIV